MSEQQQFDRLKQKFLDETVQYIAYLENVSFDDLANDKKRITMTSLRCEASESSIQLYGFINQLRIERLDEKINQLKYS